MTMASELTFGIEIELTLPTGTCEVGGYHRGTQIDGLPEGWNAQRDCSIHAGRGREGVEVVSPILKGADGFRQVKTVIAWLKTKQAKTNASCGFHVHVGIPGNREEKETIVRKLAHIVANFEKAIYATTGTKKREQGRFCQGIQNNAGYRRVYVERTSDASYLQRYHVLNVTNLHTKGTAEFRAFSGTINPVKIFGHVRLCLGLVEKASEAKKESPWVAKKPSETSPIYRKGGEGQTEVTRLFYFLGWTKGRETRTFGDVGEDVQKLKTIKKEFRRLAEKYDGPAQSS